MAGAAATVAAGCALAALAGCGSTSVGGGPVPPSCLTGARDVERALSAAPRPVALSDGTPLSRCVARATGDADLQNVGAVLTQAADDLALQARREPAMAVRLGYLIGAVRRGAAHTQGISAELVRRVEQSANFGIAPAAINDALHQGLVAGQREG